MNHSTSESVETRYFHDEVIHNLNAPREIVPYIVDLLKPKSVIDVGCGLATFAAVFQENGIADFLAVDGKWVDKDKLQIDPRYFVEVDLEKTLRLDRKFDLAICLEVAEHLAESSADILVKGLCELSDRIIFSSAIPYQGGQGHVNEQPFSYWQEKFQYHGYAYFDIFRERFWNNEEVGWWYKQNMFLVAKDSCELPAEVADHKIRGDALILVHPGLFNERYAGMRELIDTLEQRNSLSGSLKTLLRIGRDWLLRLVPRKAVR